MAHSPAYFAASAADREFTWAHADPARSPINHPQ
jgi:hypothetical protein